MIFYFIPSWYTEKHRWQTDEEPWYQPDSTGFDDSVSQIRMFRGQGEKIELLNLSYFPLLRRFLHRQGLYPLPYWSAFDKAQDIHTQSIGVLSYRDLSWPEHTEWIYSPFSIFAMVQGKRYARVNFTDGSELLSVDYYGTGGALIRTDLYDDRGFCSSYRTYQDGRETWQYFLNPYGKLQFRENLTTGAVDTEPDAGYPFRRLHYVHIREMLREILTASADDRTGNGAYIIASNSAHNRMVHGYRRCGSADPGCAWGTSPARLQHLPLRHPSRPRKEYPEPTSAHCLCRRGPAAEDPAGCTGADLCLHAAQPGHHPAASRAPGRRKGCHHANLPESPE